MAIRIDNVGIAVRDLEAAIAFFTDLGLTARRLSSDWTSPLFRPELSPGGSGIL